MVMMGFAVADINLLSGRGGYGLFGNRLLHPPITHDTSPEK